MMPIQRLFIEKSAAKYKLTKEICALFCKKDIESVDSIIGLNKPDTVEEQKKCLLLAVNKGASIREFRRMEGLVQRKEHYIYFAQNCPYDCRYCFLQCYGDHAVPVLFVNQDKILREVEDVLKSEPAPFFHTGELADSLVFDRLSGFNRKLIRLFSKYPSGTLELRTKCVDVTEILRSKPIPNVILSWTFTPEEAVRLYEKGTPSLSSRIAAAKKCQEAGFNIGARLDPIIAFNGWKNGYKETIDEIMGSLSPEKIESFVLGVFRYHPALENIIRTRFPESDLVINEFVPCIDGKLRYFKPLRTRIYKEIIGMIRKQNKEMKISLCMETPEVWEAVMQDHRPKTKD